MSKVILVLGATGTVGHELLGQLRRSSTPVRAASRRPEQQSGSGSDPLVSWVRFDYDTPATYAPALQGVDSLFMMVRPGDDGPEQTAIPVLLEARNAGVRRIILLSAMGAELRPDFGLRKVEVAIEEMGFDFTHLRPNWFMQLFSDGPLHHDITTTGALHIPAGDAAISYIDVLDIARVAHTLLTQPGHSRRAFTLTGPEPLTHADLMSTLARLTHRRLTYVPLSEEQARQGLAAAHFPPARVERLISFYRLVRTGLCAPTTDAVQQVTGQPGTRFEEFVLRNLSVW